MSSRSLSNDALIKGAKFWYRGMGWAVPSGPNSTEQRLASGLSLRPEFFARDDGMVHLVYPVGTISPATFKLQEQVLFELDVRQQLYHVVLVCKEKVLKKDESLLKEMGLGVLLVRQDAEPVFFLQPRLRYFREPSSYERVPSTMRKDVKRAIGQISARGVCQGVLDLAQVIEKQLDKLMPAQKGTPLGSKIKQAKKKGILSDFAAKAAFRVNSPRIKRAHHFTHQQRRVAIVEKAQEIVDDCLAVLFALG